MQAGHPLQQRSTTMQEPGNPIPQASRREPWNKGKLTGAKPRFGPSTFGRFGASCRSKDERAISRCSIWPSIASESCDVVRLKVEDVALHGHAVDRATVRQKKTGQPVRFEMTEQTREAVDDFIRAANKKPGQHLFTADAAATVRLRHGNMLGWSASGSPASGSTRACSAHIRYAEPRPHSFTVAPATCAQCNYC